MNRIFTTFFAGMIAATGFAQISFVGNTNTSTITAAPGAPFYFEGQVNSPGVTSLPGQGAGITCEFRYAPVSTFSGNPSWGTQASFPMTYIGDAPGFNPLENDKYGVTITTIPVGLYQFKCRCSDTNGATWVWDQGNNGNLTIAAPMAVSLSAFEGKRQGKSVQLNWTAEQEIDHASYIMERAGNDLKWQPIGNVAPVESDNASQKKYTFIDKNAPSATTNYRLRLLGTDGQSEYSKSIVVGRSSRNEVTMYPNPVENILYVDTDASLQVQIYDAYGVLVLDQKQVSEGSIEVSSLPAGMYQVLVHDASGEVIQNQKLIKN
jgi:Secretion system C-terminal sorting domain